MHCKLACPVQHLQSCPAQSSQPEFHDTQMQYIHLEVMRLEPESLYRLLGLDALQEQAFCLTLVQDDTYHATPIEAEHVLGVLHSCSPCQR